MITLEGKASCPASGHGEQALFFASRKHRNSVAPPHILGRNRNAGIVQGQQEVSRFFCVPARVEQRAVIEAGAAASGVTFKTTR